VVPEAVDLGAVTQRLEPPDIWQNKTLSPRCGLIADKASGRPSFTTTNASGDTT